MKKKQEPIYVTCKNCRKNILVDIHKNRIICPECGTEYTYLDFDEPKPVMRKESPKMVKNTRGFIKFTQGKVLRLIMIAFAVISLIFTISFFAAGGDIPGVFAAIMTLLFSAALILSFISEKQLSHPRAVMSVISFIMSAAALILIFPMAFSGADAIKNMPGKFEWADLYMGSRLPEPEKVYGCVNNNSDNILSVSIYKVSEADFMKYRDLCKQKGYSENADTSNSGYYEALSSDGYKLKLRFTDDNSYDIVLTAPEKYENISWEKNNINLYIPVPESDKGKIDFMTESGFTLIAAETEFTEYKNYCETLKKAGFDNIISEDKNEFTAKDEAGNIVKAEYTGFNCMKINYQKAD